MQLAKGDIIEVTTERLAYGGEAIARFEGLAIFIPLAAPDEQLRVRIVERKKNFARAVIESILNPSPSRRTPPCQYFGACGGCQLQHLDYASQLAEKTGFIRDALKRIGGIDWQDEIEMRSAAEFGYRLRAQIKVALDEKDELVIGFNQANSHRVCDVESCPILMPQLNESFQKARVELQRRSKEFNEYINEFEIAGDGRQVVTEPQFYDFETDELRREINGLVYHFSPTVFFQANDLLIDEFVKEATQDESGELAVDLYAGVGLFALQLAPRFTRVIGVEVHSESVEFALKNRAINEIKNVTFNHTQTDSWLQDYIRQPTHTTPDLIILDPPRIGAAEAMNLIATLAPARINYISCDPATLARDLKTLTASGYRLRRIIGFDLFPQTYHIESIAFLSKE
jgi:23S rRNA (uracil1939-C5)-methyltransferase